MAWDYKELKKAHIKEYMKENASDKQKKEFLSEVIKTRGERKSKPLFDTDGNPIMYQVKDKDGNPKFDDNGKPIMRQKIQMVEVADSKQNTYYDHVEAKKWFAKTFPTMVTNIPKEESHTKNDPIEYWDW